MWSRNLTFAPLLQPYKMQVRHSHRGDSLTWALPALASTLLWNGHRTAVLSCSASSSLCCQYSHWGSCFPHTLPASCVSGGQEVTFLITSPISNNVFKVCFKVYYTKNKCVAHQQNSISEVLSLITTTPKSILCTNFLLKDRQSWCPGEKHYYN